MEKKVVFMFSGQGSQYYHMGETLLAEGDVFKKWMTRLDQIAEPLVGRSIMQLLYDPQHSKAESFDRTLFTHPALFMVQYALAQEMLHHGIFPDYVLGSSLGEFVAAAVSNILDPEQALIAVIKQAQIFEMSCEGGGMLAVLDDPRTFRENPLLHHNSELAGVNYDGHFVIAGGNVGLDGIHTHLRDKGIASIRLPVSYAFHSKEIDPAENAFISHLRTLSLQKPAIPFCSGMYGELVEAVRHEYFWDVVRQPMRFREAVTAMEREQPAVYLDLSPSGVLANFTKRLLKDDSSSESAVLLTVYGFDFEKMNELKRTIARPNDSITGGNDKSMIAYLFPGQGSQHVGMGEGLFDEFPDLTAKADAILGYSVKELCLNDPKHQLGNTAFTQPLLYTVNALMYMKKRKETGRRPNFVAGHSLGEYNALFAAEVFDFETGLRLVKKRGELMALAAGGGMAAVIGMQAQEVEDIIRRNGHLEIDVANYNSPVQTVLSGRKDHIMEAQRIFEQAGAGMYIPLNVSGAFHSRYMNEAKKEFEQFLNNFTFNKPVIPVIANVSARPCPFNEIKRNLTEQITSSVNWTDTIRYLMGKEVELFEEVGPKDVLTKLTDKIRQSSSPLFVEDETPEEPSTNEQKNENNPPFVDRESVFMPSARKKITAASLGSPAFKERYGLKYAYVLGAMYKGIASAEMVVKAGKAGMLCFFGSGGLRIAQIEEAIRDIQRQLRSGEPYGMNFLHHPDNQALEEAVADLYLKYGITVIEASSFITMTPALIKYRAKGLTRRADGTVEIRNKIIAKVSRPEVASNFLRPAPERIIERLVQEGKITQEEGRLLQMVPVADDLCVEADSGGHTDQGSAYVLMPTLIRLRDDMVREHGYTSEISVGAAGGIGTPEAAAAAILLGADFLVTGSINQCTVEAATSDAAKDLLQQANVQDTDYAPAGDMFEIGAKIQVLKKGLFFPARANKLYDLYRHFNALEEIDEATRERIQDKFFHRSFEEIYQEVIAHKAPAEIEKAERNPKHKMALIFKWYFSYSTRLAMTGSKEHKVDYQIHCGPALGAFNQWVLGTELEHWRNRHIDQIGEMLLNETAALLNRRISELVGN